MKQEEIILINGDFTPEEAREVLLALINSKIRFHELKIFRSVELTGQQDMNSVKRLAELKESKRRIKEFIAQSLTHDTAFRIQSAVSIEVMENACADTEADELVN